MVVDFHTHNFPDALAARALASMTQRLQGRAIPVGDGTVACQLAAMAAAGIDRSVVCPIATRPQQFAPILARSRAVAQGAEGEEAARRLTFLASVHPQDPDFAAHVAEIAAAGIRGVVFHPYFQGFRLDDPTIAPLFATVRDAGLFAICHCGGDTGFLDAPMLCGPGEIAALLDAVPGLSFVACHLGGVNRNPAGSVDRLLPYETCFIDTARLVEDDANPEAERICRAFPADRILFGTDYFWREQARLKVWVESCRPDPSDRERIFHLNAERLLGLSSARTTVQ